MKNMAVRKLLEKTYDDDAINIRISDEVKEKGSGVAFAVVDGVELSFFWDEDFGIHDETAEIVKRR